MLDDDDEVRCYKLTRHTVLNVDGVCLSGAGTVDASQETDYLVS